MKKQPSIAFIIIVAILAVIPIRYGLVPLLDWGYNCLTTDRRTLAEKVKIGLRMELTNLVSGLTLKPVVTGEEPFTLTYSMPLTVDAGSYSYIPEDRIACLRLLQLNDNGRDVENCKIDRQTNGTYLVQWNAAYGPHVLQVQLSFTVNNPFGSVHINGPEWKTNIAWRIEDSTNLFQWDKSTGLELEQVRLRGSLQVPEADYKYFIL